MEFYPTDSYIRMYYFRKDLEWIFDSNRYTYRPMNMDLLLLLSDKD